MFAGSFVRMLLAMKMTFRVLVLALAFSTSIQGAEMTAASRASNDFAFSLMDRVGAGEENFAFSPFSIWSALAMTSAGSEKETLTQMLKVLGLPEGEAGHALAGGWSRSLRDSVSVEIRIANRLWGSQALPFEASFLKLSEKHYAAGLEALDFAGQSGAALRRINGWIEEQTKGHIKDLLDANNITADTKLVLTNAVYFKAKWQRQFKAHATAPRTFTNASGKESRSMTMHGILAVPYMEDKELQAVRLPYLGNTCSMIVVLPRKVDALVKSTPIDASRFTSLVASLKPEAAVNIQLPRFEVSSRKGLAKPLASAGMPRAFTQEAEFGKMCRMPLLISDVIHQAWVKVAEEGTEAAAATAVVMAPTGMPMQPAEPRNFIADHPFLFFIVDNASDGILFAGKVMSPEVAR